MTNDLALIHRVCRFIRDVQALERDIEEYPCQECPLTIDTNYGPGVQGCVMHAQELIEIVAPAHEPGVKAACSDSISVDKCPKCGEMLVAGHHQPDPVPEIL